MSAECGREPADRLDRVTFELVEARAVLAEEERHRVLRRDGAVARGPAGLDRGEAARHEPVEDVVDALPWEAAEACGGRHFAVQPLWSNESYDVSGNGCVVSR